MEIVAVFWIHLPRCQGFGLTSVVESINITAGESVAIQAYLNISAPPSTTTNSNIKVKVCLCNKNCVVCLKLWIKFKDSLLTYIICNASELDAGRYTFLIESAEDTRERESKSKSTVDVNVYVDPHISNLSQSSVQVPGINNVTCTAYGVPTPSVEWYSGDDISRVPFEQEERVYQSVNDMEATLFVANAIASDAGKYKCSACNNFGQCDNKSIQVEVYEAPIILLLYASTCKTTINVHWKPGPGCLNIIYKITATPVTALSADTKSKTITPNETNNIETTFDNLLPRTLYIIKVTLYIANLSDSRNETTGIDDVTNARVDQISEGGICIVTWSIPKGSSENEVMQYVVKIKSSPFDTALNDVMVERETKNLSISVQPIAGYNYSFSVIIESCPGNGKETLVQGKCVFERKVFLTYLKDTNTLSQVPDNSSIPVGWFLACFLIGILVTAITVLFVWICKVRCRKASDNQNTRSSSAFSNVSTGCVSNNISKPEPIESTASALPSLKSSKKETSEVTRNEYAEQTFTRYDSVLEEADLYESAINISPEYENVDIATS